MYASKALKERMTDFKSKLKEDIDEEQLKEEIEEIWKTKSTKTSFSWLLFQIKSSSLH